MHLSGLPQERQCFGSFSQLYMCAGLLQNWIKAGFYCKSATTGQHKHGVLPVPLHAATSSASLGQLTASPGAAGQEGVLPGLWAPVLSRKESLYWKQVLCEEELDSW